MQTVYPKVMMDEVLGLDFFETSLMIWGTKDHQTTLSFHMLQVEQGGLVMMQLSG